VAPVLVEVTKHGVFAAYIDGVMNMAERFSQLQAAGGLAAVFEEMPMYLASVLLAMKPMHEKVG
jgi:hypothetical protein